MDDTSPYGSPNFIAIAVISINPIYNGSVSGVSDFLFLMIPVLKVLVVNYLLEHILMTESEKQAISHKLKIDNPSLIYPM